MLVAPNDLRCTWNFLDLEVDFSLIDRIDSLLNYEPLASQQPYHSDVMATNRLAWIEMEDFIELLRSDG